MTTTLSPRAERQHIFTSAREYGQGEVEFCTLCGVRKGHPLEEQPCAGEPPRAPRTVRHDYDPFA